ncbi:YhcN/YlaJ family sporulation lipoprotein [Paenibacillus sp. CF384]|uniref:YhcN/YlaJ family sporulation lipoprotein n=1 Tax=Paenibacillus sp. CF384 TaxID=1884382 RepID=UPI000899474C|nr:YhcN/YlaJ family sporulation lipoprotein [Paenibacillus sp. CF384]SDW80023.1 sporulation lipoprotein, YhcN/YlaJ family [Paenibacillus sp. CF384]
MQRKWAVLAAGAMLTTILTGCMDKQGDLGNRNIRNNSIAYDMNGNRIINSRFANDQMNEMNRVDGHRLNSNNIIGLHKNYRLEMSKEISDRLESLPEVNKAHVMLTDDNAYVGVSLKDKSEMKGMGTRAMNVPSAPTPLSRTQRAYQRPNMNTGTMGTKISAIATGPNMLRVYNTNPAPTVPSAPSRMTRDADVTGGLKDRIANEVKQMAPTVKNVYVSANPEFFDRMDAYMSDVKLGHPIQGFIAEFNAMVDRVFPHRSGS